MESCDEKRIMRIVWMDLSQQGEVISLIRSLFGLQGPYVTRFVDIIPTLVHEVRRSRHAGIILMDGSYALRLRASRHVRFGTHPIVDVRAEGGTVHRRTALDGLMPSVPPVLQYDESGDDRCSDDSGGAGSDRGGVIAVIVFVDDLRR